MRAGLCGHARVYGSSGASLQTWLGISPWPHKALYLSPLRKDMFYLPFQVLTLLLESSSAKDLTCLIAGYYRLFVDPANPVFLWSGNRQQTHRVSAEEGEVLFPLLGQVCLFQPSSLSFLNIRGAFLVFGILPNAKEC